MPKKITPNKTNSVMNQELPLQILVAFLILALTLGFMVIAKKYLKLRAQYNQMTNSCQSRIAEPMMKREFRK